MFGIISYCSASKAYTQENLDVALKLQAEMCADMGGTEVYKPLEAVFNMKNKNQPVSVSSTAIN